MWRMAWRREERDETCQRCIFHLFRSADSPGLCSGAFGNSRGRLGRGGWAWVLLGLLTPSVRENKGEGNEEMQMFATTACWPCRGVRQRSSSSIALKFYPFCLVLHYFSLLITFLGWFGLVIPLANFTWGSDDEGKGS